MKKLFSMLILLNITLLPLQAENIRGEITAHLEGGDGPISFKPEELVVLNWTDFSVLHDGMEIKLTVPEGLRKYQNSFALLVYKNISPAPADEILSYTGGRLFMRLLSSRDSMFIRIPFSANHEFAPDALVQTAGVAAEAEDFPLIVTLVPMLKGIPDSAFRQEVRIETSPLWKNRGMVTVDITDLSGDEEERVTLTVDGQEAEPGKPINLESGIHRVRAVSSHAPMLEETVVIAPGDMLNLSLRFDYRPPELRITAPQGAAVYLDEQLMDPIESPRVVVVEPGNHRLAYRVGEMEISREFVVLPGSRLSISLIAEIGIVEYSESFSSPPDSGD